jgi:hypothetical protein
MNATIHQMTLNDPSASENLCAQGTNDAGDVVGHYFDLDDLVHGYLASNGRLTVLDHPAAVQGTFAESINNAGDIVGYYYDAADIAHGFVYSGGAYTTLDDPDAVYGTFAERIDDAGDIIGFYYDAESQPQGFVWACEAASPAADKPAPLHGYVERIIDQVLEGWAQNPRSPEEPVCLDVVIDGKPVLTTLANRYRADLEAAGLGSGRHGFAVRLPPSAASGAIEVHRSSDRVKLINRISESATRAA